MQITMSKRKGTRNEHRTMRWLEAQGYACTRAAASLGLWDVIAIGPKDNRLCQVKTNRWPGSVEREQLEMFVCPPDTRKEIWRWDDYKKEPRVEVLR